jgi:hypothetical protein
MSMKGFVLIPFIDYHTITQNRTQWRDVDIILGGQWD